MAFGIHTLNIGRIITLLLAAPVPTMLPAPAAAPRTVPTTALVTPLSTVA
jgi:hypothetical protein